MPHTQDDSNFNWSRNLENFSCRFPIESNKSIDLDININGESIFCNLARWLKSYLMNTKELLPSIKTSNQAKSVLIIFTRMQDLLAPSTYNKFSNFKVENKTIRKISKFDSGDRDSILDIYCPIILIGLQDIIEKKEALKEELDNYHLEGLSLDPRVQFFDSSIWHSYIPLDNCFERKFKIVFDEIVQNHKWCLYDTVVAREFLEFQTRLMVNSYLAPIGVGGHAEAVTPFKFHSERLMKKKADNKWNHILNRTGAKTENTNGKKEYINEKKTIKWHFLLVDDYGNAPLESDKKKCEMTKKSIIEELLKQYLEVPNIFNASGDQNSEPATEVLDSAMKHLKEQRYDIILLDYLLGKNGGKIDGDIREFGYELFDRIEKCPQVQKNKGPMNRFWIFPISVFSYAMLDELRERGINHLHYHWYVASGADPVNTPNLFCYKLLSFLDMQVSEAIIDEQQIIEFFKANPIRIANNAENDSTADSQKTSENNDGSSEVSAWAAGVLGSFLYHFGRQEILYLDKMIMDKLKHGEDNFPSSVLKIFEKREGRFEDYQHILHLLYKLAYGAGFEWVEMWQELEFVKKRMRERSVILPDTIREIESYILSLQKHYS